MAAALLDYRHPANPISRFWLPDGTVLTERPKDVQEAQRIMSVGGSMFTSVGDDQWKCYAPTLTLYLKQTRGEVRLSKITLCDPKTGRRVPALGPQAGWTSIQGWTWATWTFDRIALRTPLPDTVDVEIQFKFPAEKAAASGDKAEPGGAGEGVLQTAVLKGISLAPIAVPERRKPWPNVVPVDQRKTVTRPVPGGTLVCASVYDSTGRGTGKIEWAFVPEGKSDARKTLAVEPGDAGPMQLEPSPDGRYLAIARDDGLKSTLEIADLSALLQRSKLSVLHHVESTGGPFTLNKWEGDRLSFRSHALVTHRGKDGRVPESLYFSREEWYFWDIPVDRITNMGPYATDEVSYFANIAREARGEGAARAAQALVDLEAVEAVRELRLGLQKTVDPKIKADLQRSIDQLIALGRRRVGYYVSRLYDDPGANHYCAALVALGEIGDSRAVPELYRVLYAPKDAYWARRDALKALAQLTGEPLDSGFVGMGKDFDCAAARRKVSEWMAEHPQECAKPVERSPIAWSFRPPRTLCEEIALRLAAGMTRKEVRQAARGSFRQWVGANGSGYGRDDAGRLLTLKYDSPGDKGLLVSWTLSDLPEKTHEAAARLKALDPITIRVYESRWDKGFTRLVDETRLELGTGPTTARPGGCVATVSQEEAGRLVEALANEGFIERALADDREECLADSYILCVGDLQAAIGPKMEMLRLLQRLKTAVLTNPAATAALDGLDARVRDRMGMNAAPLAR